MSYLRLVLVTILLLAIHNINSLEITEVLKHGCSVRTDKGIVDLSAAAKPADEKSAA